MHGQAGQVASSDQNTEHLSAEDTLADLQANTVAGGLLIPAAVGELVRLQDKGYRMITNA